MIALSGRRLTWHALAVAVLAASWGGDTMAYPRYNSGCNNCHGAFTDGTSPKMTVFPMNSKHEMHRNVSFMATQCDLCHTNGDGRDPFTGSSNGLPGIPGVGCVGCHGRDYGGAIGVSGVGLRAHHIANGMTFCASCHPNDPAPLPESVSPPYYGTTGTNADDPCNSPPNLWENWSVGDTEGLDNDGNRRYDAADPDCSVPVTGDMDCNGTVEVTDIAPFALALTDPNGYAAMWPLCDINLADVNVDGAVNGGDVAPFVGLLLGP